MPIVRPGRYHLLALVVVVLTTISLFMIGRALTRIETSLPMISLHQERDFSVFLLDVMRLDSALQVARAVPTPAHIEALTLSLDIAAARSRDNFSLYRDSHMPGLVEFNQRFDREVQALEAVLKHEPVNVEQLHAHVRTVDALRRSLQTQNDALFQAAMQRASTQQIVLAQLGQSLPIMLIVLGGFALAVLFFALRQQNSIKMLNARETQLRASESSYQAVVNELRRSNDELEQFAYAISHDMRQPLRMIASYQQLLEKALCDKLDDDTRQYLHFATDGAKRLDQMLVALLDYSRVGRKTEPPALVSSRETLDEAMLYLKPDIDSAHAAIHIEGDWPSLNASRDELVRLFQNLIGNAVKYRDTARTPDVLVSGKLADGRWKVQISDNGIGFDPTQKPRLFQVFQRLQSHAKFEGAGVGLALCRKIVEHHGGHIEAESAGDGQGSSFTFDLPISASVHVKE